MEGIGTDVIADRGYELDPKSVMPDDDETDTALALADDFSLGRRVSTGLGGGEPTMFRWRSGCILHRDLADPSDHQAGTGRGLFLTSDT